MTAVAALTALAVLTALAALAALAAMAALAALAASACPCSCVLERTPVCAHFWNFTTEPSL